MSSPDLRAWRQMGYNDGVARRPARTPLRDDGGAAAQAYSASYRRGRERASALSDESKNVQRGAA